jgi:formylglycine-generating enzyme required for sulfatase activity
VTTAKGQRDACVIASQRALAEIKFSWTSTPYNRVSLGKDDWGLRGATWKKPGFKQGPTDPVVGVSWEDAMAFCDWLTKLERGSGVMHEDMRYRLPTDQEWSVAVGLPSELGNTPEEKHAHRQVYYPWGKQWPPPIGAGNYCGEEWKTGYPTPDWPVIKGYNDGYPRTSPVGSFAANMNGLYDMGGNVWQWCIDWYNSDNEERVRRGASWANASRDDLLASYHNHGVPNFRCDDIGFRCVVAAAESSR